MYNQSQPINNVRGAHRRPQGEPTQQVVYPFSQLPSSILSGVSSNSRGGGQPYGSHQQQSQPQVVQRNLGPQFQSLDQTNQYGARGGFTPENQYHNQRVPQHQLSHQGNPYHQPQRDASRSQSTEGFFAPVAMQAPPYHHQQQPPSASLPNFDNQFLQQDVKPTQGSSQGFTDSLAVHHFSNQHNTGQSDQQSLDENYLSQTMRNLADKAFELSKKHNLKDEVKMIQEEERKLEQYLQQEQAKASLQISPDRHGQSPGLSKKMPQLSANQQSKLNLSGRKGQGSSANRKGVVSGKQGLSQEKMRGGNYNNDQNTTASQSHFLEEPIDHDVDIRSDVVGDTIALQMMNQSAVPNDFTDPMLERFMRSQALSHHSEMQIDKAVNRLFDDAGRKKMKLEKMRMENMLTQLSETKATPTIDANSQNITARMRQPPIHMRVEQVQAQKRRREEALRQLEQEKKEQEEAELTFKPTINTKSKRIATRSTSRQHGNFVEREQMFLINKNFTQAESQKAKLTAEASHLTFKPNVNKSTKTPKRINGTQANNFWERNVAFMNQKEEKRKKMDQVFNKELKFQPAILPKSREMSRGDSKTRSQFRSKPWGGPTERSSSRGSTTLNSGVLTQRSRRNSNRDLNVAGFSKFTRPRSREAEPLSNSLGRIDFKNQVASVQQPHTSAATPKPQASPALQQQSPNHDQQQRVHTEVAIANSEAFNMTLVSESIGVMNDTRQFGQPVANFGMEMQPTHQANQFSMSNQSFSQLQGMSNFGANGTTHFSQPFDALDGYAQEEHRQMQQQFKQLHTETHQRPANAGMDAKQKWNDIFNPPTVKDATDPEAQNQFTFVESSDNEQLKPEDLAMPPKRGSTNKSSKRTLDSKTSQRSASRRKGGPSKSPNFRQLTHNSAGNSSINFSQKIRGGHGTNSSKNSRNVQSNRSGAASLNPASSNASMARNNQNIFNYN